MLFPNHSWRQYSRSGNNANPDPPIARKGQKSQVELSEVDGGRLRLAPSAHELDGLHAARTTSLNST